MATLAGDPPEPSRPTYVRVCPVCDTANPPELARCACGASLTGIDFSLLAPAPRTGAGEAASTSVRADEMSDVEASGVEASPVEARLLEASRGEAPPLEAPPLKVPPVEVPPVEVPPAHPAPAAASDAMASAPSAAVSANRDATAPPRVAAAGDATTPESATPVAEDGAAPLICPHADCAQPNPPGALRCVYCNRPLHDEPALAGARPLPRALRDRYRVIEAFPATGSEADILLVVDRDSGDKAVVKLYRRGIQPDFRLLRILGSAVGDTVVQVLDHGVSDGTAFEVLEYIPGGTLEALLRSGPLPKSDIRRIVQQIADALRGIHAQRILHRDLKPENVLVRTTTPLSLALTDFGIASFAAATQHFTSVARTTKYAAPEVLTGVLDAKSDWWSLGMIVLEAASGRHPFDGLSEQVMNHQLATRPIDVRGVFDDDLRLLCRGLLLRDPKRRFGADEVARWLAGDTTLAVGPDAEGAATSVRPYRIGKSEASTGPELALALARHWDAARRDLARGHVAHWIERELHDYNLLRTLRDVQDMRDLSDDGRLLRFLVAAAPDLPPIWRGSPVTVDAVLAAARAGARGDDTAIDWLDSLVGDDVLASFASSNPALRTLASSWNAAWERFAAAWERARAAEEAHAKRPRDVGGGAAVSFDDLVYGHHGRLELPPRRAQNPALLLAGTDAAYVDALRGEVVAALGELTGFCPWFDSAWEAMHDDAAGILAAHALLPYARDAAMEEKRRQAASAEARMRTRVEAQQELRAQVSRILALSPKADEDLESGALHELLQAFDGVQRACTAIAQLAFTDEESERLRASAEKLASFGAQAQRSLARIEEVRATNAIFLTRQRITGALIAFGVALLLRQPVLLVVLLVGATLVVAYRWYSGFHVTEAALKRLRLFGLHGRSFLRGTDPPEEGTAPDGTRSARASATAASGGRGRWWRRDPS